MGPGDFRNMVDGITLFYILHFIFRGPIDPLFFIKIKSQMTSEIVSLPI